MRIVNNGRNFNNESLSNEQIQKFAPSAFAGQAFHKQSDRYAFIPTSDIIDGMRNAGFLPVSASQSRSRVEGKSLFTKHMLRFCSMDQTLVKVGDTRVEVALVNSHDGTSQYELSLAPFRLACLNGMMVSEGLVETIKVRHIGNIIERVIESTHSIIMQAPKVVAAIQQWRQITLNQDEQRILAEGALALRFEDQAPIQAVKLLEARRSSDTSDDLYTVFNRIQENVIRGGFRYVTPGHIGDPATHGGYVEARRNRTREVKGIDQNNTLNRQLWALGQKMADLKS